MYFTNRGYHLCVPEYYHNNVLIENVAHMYRNFGQKAKQSPCKEYIIPVNIRSDNYEKIYGKQEPYTSQYI